MTNYNIQLSVYDELEYYRNRCHSLEQENRQLRKDIESLHREIAELKQTVSTLVARNIKAKPNKTETAKKKKTSRHPRKSRSRRAHIDDAITVDQKEENPLCASLEMHSTH